MARYVDIDLVMKNIQQLRGCTCSCSDGIIDDVEMMMDMTPDADVIPIPDGATRRDAFKAVFGYEPATDAVVCNKEDWCGASEPCNYCTSNPDNIGREEEWWDAPYKREVEE